jgi:hypothetical protein
VQMAPVNPDRPNDSRPCACAALHGDRRAPEALAGEVASAASPALSRPDGFVKTHVPSELSRTVHGIGRNPPCRTDSLLREGGSAGIGIDGLTDICGADGTGSQLPHGSRSFWSPDTHSSAPLPSSAGSCRRAPDAEDRGDGQRQSLAGLPGRLSLGGAHSDGARCLPGARALHGRRDVIQPARVASAPAVGPVDGGGGLLLGRRDARDGCSEVRASWRLLAAAAVAGLRVPVRVDPWAHLEASR